MVPLGRLASKLRSRVGIRTAAAALAAFAAAFVLAGAVCRIDRIDNEKLPCGEGFTRRGTRCCVGSARSSLVLREGSCSTGALAQNATCPPPLVVTSLGCDAPPNAVVHVPATTVLMGPSDWEAEGRVRPRTVRATAFAMDRFEVTAGQVQCSACPEAVAVRFAARDVDPACAASHVTLDEARAVCAARGGRLPTEDEWIVAAAGARPRRYPWGDTGAVCRRAAWGLSRGPCATGAVGPDTVGAHPDGASPEGIHDLAGNVSEWVETSDGCDASGAACLGVVRGGSYETDLATELRTWARREVPSNSSEASIGFRCAYDSR